MEGLALDHSDGMGGHSWTGLFLGEISAEGEGMGGGGGLRVVLQPFLQAIIGSYVPIKIKINYCSFCSQGIRYVQHFESVFERFFQSF